MPKRTYWDRSLFKDVREVYKPRKVRSKRRQKREHYQSLGYRAFLVYLRKRFGGNLLALQIVEDIYNRANRHGFIRRYLALVNDEKLPEPKQIPRDPRLVAYEKEFRPYKRKSTYVVPETFLTYDEELQAELALMKNQHDIQYERSKRYGIVDELDFPNLSILANKGVPMPSFQQIKKGHDDLLAQSFKLDAHLLAESDSKSMRFDPKLIPILNPQSLVGISTTGSDLLSELYDKANIDLNTKIEDALSNIPKDELQNYRVDITSGPHLEDGKYYINAKITKKDENES